MQGGARPVLLGALMLLVPAGAWDKISCPQRINTAGVARDPSAMFVCPAGAYDALKYTAPAQWYTLAESGSGSAMNVYAGAWLRGGAPCCRHCVWELGYPAIDPIVLASDRTSTNATFYLDCAAFATEFRALDRNSDATLDEEELKPFLRSGFNKMLGADGSLNEKLVFRQADLDENSRLSREEWLVLRHFWSPVLASQAGPLQRGDEKLAAGPLGGFFWDENVIEIFMTNAVNTMLEQVSQSKKWACGCVSPAAVCPADCPWQSGYLRESSKSEGRLVLRNFDLDGTGVISLEEHYFRNFADQDGNGRLDTLEYYESLYSKRTPQEVVDTPARGYNFALHDLNGDGNVTFIERKFFSSDVNPQDFKLTRQEWRQSGLSMEFWPFEGHMDEVSQTVTVEGFSYYTLLHECALQGMRLYQRPLTSHPLADWCSVRVLLQNAAPWVSGAITGQMASGRRAAAEGSSFMLEMWKEMAARQRWNSELTVVPKSSSIRTNMVGKPALTGSDYGVFEAGMFSQWQGGDGFDPKYACSRSFLPELDGFVVVVRSNEDEISLTVALITMVASNAFINFSAFLVIILICLGNIFWLLERKTNSNQFAESYGKGVLDGAWYCIVTMSTVGYGDKVPVTAAGRSLGLIWILFGIVIFGILTGLIASAINTTHAEASIDGVQGLGGFKTGLLESSRFLNLGETYQFEPVYCATVGSCHDMLGGKEVSALLLPQTEVLFHFVTSGLAKAKCGNPFRTIGDAILTAEYPSAKMCIWVKGVYAGQYLIDAINQGLDELDAVGFTGSLKDILLAMVESGNSAHGCSQPSQYDEVMIIACSVTMFLFYATNNYVDSRKSMQTSLKMQFLMGSTHGKTPEQLAHQLGLKWKAITDKNRQLRAQGLTVPRPGESAQAQAISLNFSKDRDHEDLVLLVLRRVRLLSSSLLRDTKQLQDNIENSVTVTNLRFAPPSRSESSKTSKTRN